MENNNKFYIILTIIIFVGFSFLVNSILITESQTRRTADEIAKIETVKTLKLLKSAEICKESGGIATVYSNSIDCKVPKK